jgi:hypothetical protein
MVSQVIISYLANDKAVLEVYKASFFARHATTILRSFSSG